MGCREEGSVEGLGWVGSGEVMGCRVEGSVEGVRVGRVVR